MRIDPKTYGAEIEKPVANLKTGQPHGVSQLFFKSLANFSKERKSFKNFHHSDIKSNIIIGSISEDLGEQGLDNGFNLLETSLNYKNSLEDLQKAIQLDLTTSKKALQREDASIINLSINPLIKRDRKNYKKYVAPKGVYKYIWSRGWDHASGIDARAQNSPTTGVNVSQAADALSVIIGAGAAFIGLFANSPFEEGKRSNFKESRLTMWDRMMKGSTVEGDRITSKFPPHRFKTLAEYFNWMFGGKTGMHFVFIEENKKDYKAIGDKILIIEGNPSILEYLSKKEWKAYSLKDLSKKTMVTPKVSHMEVMQFTQFAGARIRYGFKNHNEFPINEFLEACRNPESKRVEKIFEKYTNFLYIEGRDPGANFPDKEILNAGKDIAGSIVISPSAIQAGLIRNLEKTRNFIDRFDWQHLNLLRDAAIKDGLQGKANGLSVYDFAKEILEIASAGLSKSEQKMLSYPEWVLKTRRNGADRAIEFVEKRKGKLEDSLKELIKVRKYIDF